MARRRPRRHEDGRLAVHRERKPYRVDVVGRSAGRWDEGSSPPDPNLRLYPGRGKGFAMTKLIATLPWVLGLCLALSPAPTQAIDFGGLAKEASGRGASGELAAGCDQKLKKLANTLVDAKKRLNVAGVTSFKFEVSGHTDSSGKPEHNKELSGKRAAVIERELIARGIAKSEIVAVGMGSDRPLVTPDNTPAKKAKNRRYEIQLRF